jgi:hypothetical protein
VVRHYPYVLALMIFEVQMLLGAFACWTVRGHFITVAARESVQIPDAYPFLMALMVITLVSNMVFWPTVGVVMDWKRLRKWGQKRKFLGELACDC